MGLMGSSQPSCNGTPDSRRAITTQPDRHRLILSSACSVNAPGPTGQSTLSVQDAEAAIVGMDDDLMPGLIA